MEDIKPFALEKDIKVFGNEVETFPNGIDQAFTSLIDRVPDGRQRSYFGISYMKENRMAYFAMAEEKSPGEGKAFQMTEMIVQKGDYLSIRVKDWRDKTHQIKNVFEKLLEHPKADNKSPAVEWYQNDNEMMCLLKKK